jgi:sugar lactone lactonase YvrE
MRGITIIALCLLAIQASPAPVRRLPSGNTEELLELRPLIDMPEGIAIDSRGSIFVGNRRLENDKRVSEILEITRDGTVTVYATLDPGHADDFATGVLGLAIDSQGDLYASLASFKQGTHGVWRIGRGGEVERLAGSRRMLLPNAIAFDARENIYVTDSADGAIWRFPKDGRGRRWIRHALLAPDPNFGIGANGIAFVPPRELFVANTDLGLIARVGIKPNGDPAEPEVVAAGLELLTVDGLAADAHGNLHAVIAAASAFGISPVVRVNPRTGAIDSSTTQAEKFDFPTSLAFGRGSRDHKSVYVINGGLFPEGRPEAAPGVIRVAVGVPGAQFDTTQNAVAEGPGQLGFPFPPFPTEVAEAGTVITVSVRRTDGSTGAVSADYATVSGSAKAGLDFTSVSGTLTWGDGDTDSKVISVAILDDAAVESGEDFQIHLDNPTGGATIFGNTKQIRILDNDPGLGFVGSSEFIGEADGSVSLAVLRTGGSAGPVSVNYATASGSATSDVDFTAASGVLNWADGDTAAKVFNISVTNDASDESNETFTVTLTDPSAGMALGSNATATVTIVDDDATAGGGGGGGGSSGGGGAPDCLALLFLACLMLQRERWPCLLAKIQSR